MFKVLRVKLMTLRI